MTTDYVCVGEVVKPQGLRGEVKVRAGDFSQRLTALEHVRMEQGGTACTRRVLGARAGSGFAYLHLEGVSTREDAEALRGARVLVPREETHLGEEENFIADLIGLTAVDTQGHVLGRLCDVLRPNAVCDVYAFDTPQGEMLLPALRRVVLRVDLSAGEIVLDEHVLPEVAVWQGSGKVQGSREEED